METVGEEFGEGDWPYADWELLFLYQAGSCLFSVMSWGAVLMSLEHGIGKLERNWIFETIKSVDTDIHLYEAKFSIDRMSITETTLDSYFVLRRMPVIKQMYRRWNNSVKYNDWEYGKKVGDRLEETGIVSHRNYSPVRIEDLRVPLVEWAKEVKKYRMSGDQWSINDDQRRTMGCFSATKGDNGRFAQYEAIEVRALLGEMVHHAEHGLGVSDDKLAELIAKVDYLSTSLDRLGRMDWRNVAIGALFSLGLDAVLTSDQVRGLLLWLAISIEPLNSLPSG